MKPLLVLTDGLAGEPDQPFHERRAGVPRLADARSSRSREDDDLAALRTAEVVGEAVHQDAVARRGAAARAGPGAVERRLHRVRRDPIRLGDFRLEDEHEPDRQGDREEPVDDLPPRVGQAVEQRNAHGLQDRPATDSVVPGEPVADDLHVALALLDVRHVGGLLEADPLRAGDAVEEGLLQRRRRLVVAARDEERRHADLAAAGP